jgi:hypothetical protein
MLKKRKMISRQKSLLARTNSVNSRIGAMESILAARQAIARSQALRQQYAAFTRSGSMPSSRFFQHSSTTPSINSMRSLQQQGNQVSSIDSSLARRGPILATKFLTNNYSYPSQTKTSSNAATSLFGSSRLTNRKSPILASTKVLSNEYSYPFYGKTSSKAASSSFGRSQLTKPGTTKYVSNTYESIPTSSSLYKSRSGPLPSVPVSTTKMGRIKKWIKKHKTPLIITGAGIALPAAIGGGLQAAAESRQDARDANMLEASKSLLLPPSSTEPLSFVSSGGGGGGGGGGVGGGGAQRYSWQSRYRSAPKFANQGHYAKQRTKQQRRRKTVKKTKVIKTTTIKRKAAKKNKNKGTKQVKICVTKKTAKGKLTKCVKKMAKNLLEYKKLKSNVTAAYIPALQSKSKKKTNNKLKYKQLASGLNVAYPAF